MKGISVYHKLHPGELAEDEQLDFSAQLAVFVRPKDNICIYCIVLLLVLLNSQEMGPDMCDTWMLVKQAE